MIDRVFKNSFCLAFRAHAHAPAESMRGARGIVMLAIKPDHYFASVVVVGIVGVITGVVISGAFLAEIGRAHV